MKYNKERLETMGFEPGRDLCLARVRPDGENMRKIDELLSKSEFPFCDIKAPSDLPYSMEKYFNLVKELEYINFPFTKKDSVSRLFYSSVELGLCSLKKVKKGAF